MALAEVVERDAVAVLAQVADGLRDDGLIFNKGRFRDFDLEVDSRQSVLFGQVIENPDRVDTRKSRRDKLSMTGTIGSFCRRRVWRFCMVTLVTK